MGAPPHIDDLFLSSDRHGFKLIIQIVGWAFGVCSSASWCCLAASCFRSLGQGKHCGSIEEFFPSPLKISTFFLFCRGAHLVEAFVQNSVLMDMLRRGIKF